MWGCAWLIIVLLYQYFISTPSAVCYLSWELLNLMVYCFLHILKPWIFFLTCYLCRQSWSSQFDLRESHLLAISAAEQEFLNADSEGYAATSARGIAFCHTIALIVCLIALLQLVSLAFEYGIFNSFLAFDSWCCYSLSNKFLTQWRDLKWCRTYHHYLM